MSMVLQQDTKDNQRPSEEIYSTSKIELHHDFSTHSPLSYTNYDVLHHVVLGTIFSHTESTNILTLCSDLQNILQGDEEHVSGWDLVYDSNGYIEIDPERCGYSSFLGAAVPEAEVEEEELGEEDVEESSEWRREANKRRQKQK